MQAREVPKGAEAQEALRTREGRRQRGMARADDSQDARGHQGDAGTTLETLREGLLYQGS